jgi:hypothetical protein
MTKVWLITCVGSPAGLGRKFQAGHDTHDNRDRRVRPGKLIFDETINEILTRQRESICDRS